MSDSWCGVCVRRKDKISQIELLFQMKRKIISCTKITSFKIRDQTVTFIFLLFGLIRKENL